MLSVYVCLSVCISMSVYIYLYTYFFLPSPFTSSIVLRMSYSSPHRATSRLRRALRGQLGTSQVEPYAHDLGDILLGQEATSTAQLINKGPHPLSYSLTWLPDPADAHSLLPGNSSVTASLGSTGLPARGSPCNNADPVSELQCSAVPGDHRNRSGPGAPAAARNISEGAPQSHVSHNLHGNAAYVADDVPFKASPMQGVVPGGASQPLTIQFKPGISCLNWQRKLQVDVKGAPAQILSVNVLPAPLHMGFLSRTNYL